jgi:hypothetical protein
LHANLDEIERMAYEYDANAAHAAGKKTLQSGFG